MNWNLCVLEELKKGNLGTVSDWDVAGGVHLDSGLTVIEDTFLDELDSVCGEFTMKKCIFSSVLDLSSLTVELRHFHIVHGNGSCLTAAYFLD